MSALRGCDTAAKNDNSKQFVRFLCSVFLHDAGAGSGDFMKHSLSKETIYQFSKEFDQHPVNYLLHLIHAFEIIGYLHPSQEVRNIAYYMYSTMVRALHMSEGSEEQMQIRLRDGVDVWQHTT